MEDSDDEDNKSLEEQSEEDNDYVSGDDSEEGRLYHYWMWIYNDFYAIIVLLLENESSGEEGESISDDTSDDQESDGAEIETTETHNRSKETLTKKAGPKSKSIQIGEENNKNTISKKDKPLERKGSKFGSNQITSNSQNNSLISNEYDDYDTSDEEDIRNTVGNVPKNW